LGQIGHETVTIYVIGDIQGCAKSFNNLLEKLAFDQACDHLWLTGDLVNRGPDSLSVLRRLVKMDNNVTTVLGNHDLHLLAIAAGVRLPTPEDTLQEILEAPDLEYMINWLRHRPLLHYDEKNDRALVHAGFSPSWSLEEARTQADEVANMLKSTSWKNNLKAMYGNEPNAWTNSLKLSARRRFSINALTRIRFCDEAGRLDFTHKGPPSTQPETVQPWYDFIRPGGYQTHIYFGHWASLGLARLPDCTCIDTGCVWGRQLTALPIDPPGEPISVPYAENDFT
jgi:bis(5'-nucleosyl)-tetraphosphatase (symmetrical)